jgi:hypothetical protein
MKRFTFYVEIARSRESSRFIMAHFSLAYPRRKREREKEAAARACVSAEEEGRDGVGRRKSETEIYWRRKKLVTKKREGESRVYVCVSGWIWVGGSR